MRRFACLSMSLLLTVVVAATSSSPALALPAITNLRVSLTENGGEPAGRQNPFPPGTERIFVLFDYHEAANDELVVLLASPTGAELFRAGKRYSGNGTVRTPITGVDVYRSMAEALETSLEDAQVNADKVLTQQVGQQEYLYQAKASAVAAQSTLELLKQLKLDSAATGQLRAIEQAVGVIAQRVDDALLTDNIDSKKKAAEEIKRVATESLDKTAALRSDANDAKSMSFPETGLSADSTYTVQVRVGPYLARSADFQIGSESKENRTPEPTRTVITGLPAPQTPGNSSAATARSTSPGGGGSAAGVPPAPGTSAPGMAGVQRSLTGQATAASDAQAAGTSTPDAAASGPSAEMPLSGRLSSKSESAVMPTWTVPAGAQAATLQAGPEQTEAAGSGARPMTKGSGPGPNLAVLVIGLGVLIALAVWIRRRMV